MVRFFASSVFIIFVFVIGIFAQEKSSQSHNRYSEVKLSGAEIQKMEALIDQLLASDEEETNGPALATDAKSVSEAAYWNRFDRAKEAFGELMEWKERAFPILVNHLQDKRNSFIFRNHYIDNSIGKACYWNIYYQLLDRPRNYSTYGYARMGKDGKPHPKPAWNGSPFDEAGGLKQWLDNNKALTYPEMQIKCLKWMLDCELEIGASDAESYYINILPLEIQILKHQMEMGIDVQSELSRKEAMIQHRDPRDVPADLLPTIMP